MACCHGNVPLQWLTLFFYLFIFCFVSERQASTQSIITVSNVQKYSIHTRTSLFSVTMRFTVMCVSTASDLMIMPLRRVLELLNCWFVPEHVLEAVLTLPVPAPQEANTTYNSGFSH